MRLAPCLLAKYQEFLLKNPGTPCQLEPLAKYLSEIPEHIIFLVNVYGIILRLKFTENAAYYG